jgi:hypothetical protein
MGKRESKDRPEPPQPSKAEKPVEGSPEDSMHGIPPGVRFDTEEGRRAQGGDEDFAHKRPAEPARDDDETEIAE